MFAMFLRLTVAIIDSTSNIPGCTYRFNIVLVSRYLNPNGTATSHIIAQHRLNAPCNTEVCGMNNAVRNSIGMHSNGLYHLLSATMQIMLSATATTEP